MSRIVGDKIGKFLPFFVIAFVVVLYTIIASKLVDVSFISIFPANVLLFIAFCVYFKDFKGAKKYQLICILLFVVDLILIIYNSVNRNLPFTGVDWSNYDNFAKDALAKSGNIFGIFQNSIDLFTACIATIYKIFGANITIVYFYILPLSFILSHYLYKTVFLITKDKKRSMLFSVIVLLMPVNFIFSLSVLREIPIQCVSVISLYFFISYMFGEKKHGLLLALIFAVLATLMHSGMIAIPVVYLYVSAQKKMFKNVKILRVSTFIFAAILILLVSLPIFSPLTKRFNMGGGLEGITDSISAQNNVLISYNATTNYVDSAPENVWELILSLPYRIIMFVIAPLPWQINSMETLVAFFADAIFRYYIVFRVIRTMFRLSKYSVRDREVIDTTFMAVILFDLIFCLGTTNYGTAMRHRAKMLPFELVIIAISSIKEESENNARK